MLDSERDALTGRVRDWFDADEQVRWYAAELDRGPTREESGLLADLPASLGDVIDLGCGAGRISIELARRGARVTGVDVSERLLRIAQRQADRSRLGCRFVQVEPLVLPFRARSFDAACAFKVYGYIPSTTARAHYLAEIARIVRPGSPVLLTQHVVPAENEAAAAIGTDPRHALAAAEFTTLESLDTFSAGHGYVHWFTADALLAELSASPFTVEKTHEDPANYHIAILLRKRRQAVPGVTRPDW